MNDLATDPTRALPTKEGYSEDLKDKLTSVAIRLVDRFEQIAKNRKATEDRWLKDLRQYKGIYEPETMKRLTSGKGRRSTYFARMTRTKVKAMDSRLMDMLFPVNNDKNWEINPTPKPEVGESPMMAKLLDEWKASQAPAVAEQMGVTDPEQITPEQQQSIAMAMSQLQPPQDVIDAAMMEAAKQACANMSKEIDDQLTEIKHRDVCATVIHSGNLYGTGILKSPLVQKKKRRKWAQGPEGWALTYEDVLLPYEECTSIWDYYPDETASKLEDCEIHFEFHAMNRSQVLALIGMPGFEQAEETIRSYLRDYRYGDHNPRSFETDLQTLNSDNDTANRQFHNRYRVLECWTQLQGVELLEAGFTEEELHGADNVWCNIWMLGHFIIKVAIGPLPGKDHPYHAYYYDKDETSFWGQGIAENIRDDQSGLNATMRACMDNMGSTAGAMYEVNVDLLDPREDPRDVYPNRVFLRRGDARSRAVNDIQVNSRINEFMAMRDHYSEMIHENTLPAYMHGDQNIQGAGKTMGGLSMLMGSANINVKEQVRHFDDGITRPAIEGMYHWNMEFNEKQDIKGDFVVAARGSSSLVAKEVRAQNLDWLLTITNNPNDQMLVKRQKLLGEAIKTRDLVDTDFIRTEEEYDAFKQTTAQLQAVTAEVEQLKGLLQLAAQTAPRLMRDIQEQAAGGAPQVTQQ